MTGLLATRRRALQLGGAMALSVTGGTARSAVAAGPRFCRGVNAWPWLAMPVPDPPAGRPYPSWPPFLPDRPVPTRSDLRRLAAAGLDFVRLVVDPAPFLNAADAAGSGQSAALLSLLESHVLEADAAGLGVVVNLQPGGSPRRTAERLYGTTASTPGFQGLADLTAAVAGRIGRLHVGRIALEPVNEPPQNVAVPGDVRDWDRKQAALLRAARAAAPSLTLVATGAGGGGPEGLRALDGRGLAAAHGPLLFTFHFYEPFLFSHQGAPWLAEAEPHYRWLNRVPWPGGAGTLEDTMDAVRARMEADRRASTSLKRAAYATTEAVMRSYFAATVDRSFVAPFFAAVAEWAVGNGIAADRILLGEFGALKSTTTALDIRDAPQQSVTGGPYVAADPDHRARYLRDVRLTAEEHGFGWAMWTLFNPGMGLMDETSRVLDPALVPALGLKPG